MNILRQLRWKLTLSYTLVTLGAFLVVILVMGGIIFTRIFVPENVLTPEVMVDVLRENSTPLWGHVLSQSPVDTELIRLLLKDTNATITGFDFLRIGDIEFSVSTVGSLRAYILGADGILLGISEPYYLSRTEIGKPFDTHAVQGFSAPIKAALAGETDSRRLYTEVEANNRVFFGISYFQSCRRGGGGGHCSRF